jgi:hypothetical protein
MKQKTEKKLTRLLRLPTLALALSLVTLSWSVAPVQADSGASAGDPQPTTTTLQCSPATVKAGQSVHCTATLSGADHGEVDFKALDPAAGSFSSETCNLGSEPADPHSCSVDYTSAADAPTANQALVAVYLGNADSALSHGEFTLAVEAAEQGGDDEQGEVVEPAPASPVPAGATAAGKQHRCAAHCRRPHRRAR